MFRKSLAKLKYTLNVYKIKSAVLRKVWIKSRGIIPNCYDEKKAIFVHIPKVAGRSVAGGIFGNEKPGHYYSKDYKIASAAKHKNYYKFTFVREPLDRLHSSYNYLIAGGGNAVDEYFGAILVKETKSFEDFVLNWLDETKIESWIHLVPQSRYIYLVDGTCGVDFIGKFENINADFSLLTRTLKLDLEIAHSNRSLLQKNINYSPLVIRKVRHLYKQDYINFGY